MKGRTIVTTSALMVLAGAAITVLASTAQVQILLSPSLSPANSWWREFNGVIVSEYRPWLREVIAFQEIIARKLFFGILTIVPLIFLAHYLAIGPKSFSHQGEKVLFFSAFTRMIHWIAAASFTVLVVTGTMIVFAKPLGGGLLLREARLWHVGASILFGTSAMAMFVIWIRDMLPALHDLKWLVMMGGYLTKEKRPVPAGKFNAGQKTWFWLVTAGGAVMAWTGWCLYGLDGDTGTLRLYLLIHGYLAALLTAFFIIHLYMSLFAIKGALRSMIDGYKPLEEVQILHSLYKTGRK